MHIEPFSLQTSNFAFYVTVQFVDFAPSSYKKIKPETTHTDMYIALNMHIALYISVLKNLKSIFQQNCTYK